MNYKIQPSYKVTDKGLLHADDSRTVTNEDGAVIATASLTEWNSTATITIFKKDTILKSSKHFANPPTNSMK